MPETSGRQFGQTYMVFLCLSFIAMFRMAFYIIRLTYLFNPGRSMMVMSVLVDCMYRLLTEAVQWWLWWTQLFLLKLTFVVGILIYPIYIYSNVVIYVNADTNVQHPSSFRSFRRSRSVCWASVLPLHRNACVLTHVFNIQAEHNAFLRRPMLRYEDTLGCQCIQIWNHIRKIFLFSRRQDGRCG